MYIYIYMYACVRNDSQGSAPLWLTFHVSTPRLFHVQKSGAVAASASRQAGVLTLRGFHRVLSWVSRKSKNLSW